MADYYSNYKPKVKPPKEWVEDSEAAAKLKKPEVKKTEPEVIDLPVYTQDSRGNWIELDKDGNPNPVLGFEELEYSTEPGIEEMGDFIPKLKKKALERLRSSGYEGTADVVDILSPNDMKDVALGGLGIGLISKLGKALKKGKKFAESEWKILKKADLEWKNREFPDVERPDVFEKLGRVPPKVSPTK